MSELRTWRQRIATPLRGSGDEIPAKEALTNRTNRTNPDFLRESLSETVIGQTSESSDKPLVLPRPRLIQTGPNTWIGAEWARGLCVNCDEPVATGDLIACAEHRRQIDAIVMPWDAVP